MSTGNGGWDFSNYTPPRQEQGSGAPYGGYGAPPAGPAPFSDPAAGQPPFGAPQPGGPGPGPFSGGAPAPAVDPFGTRDSTFADEASRPLGAVKAPIGWLVAALVVAVVAGVVASILGGISWVAIVCWALAGPVVIGLLAVYLAKDVKGRAHLTYSPPLFAPVLYSVVLVVAFIAVMIASLQIAFWVGRM